MNLRIPTCVCLVWSVLLSACGGGAGGSGSGDGGAIVITLERSARTVEVNDEAPHIAPITIKARAANAPLEGFAAGLNWTTNAVEYATLQPISAAEADIQVQFRPIHLLPVGTYTDQIDMIACYDEYCRRPIEGSPFKVTVTTVVSDAGPETTITVPSELRATALLGSTAPTLSTVATLDGIRPSGAFLRFESVEGPAIKSVREVALSATQRRLEFELPDPATLGPGLYFAGLYVRVCYDPQCSHPRTDGRWLSVSYRVMRYPVAQARKLELGANDIVWDASTARMYAALSGSASVNPGTVSPLDPATGVVEPGVFVGAEPYSLALSEDGSKLYAGLGGASRVTRLTMPGLTPDLSIPLGLTSYGRAAFPVQIRPAPGKPDVLAVLLGHDASTHSPVNIAIYDGATRRPALVGDSLGRDNVVTLAWGASDARIYAEGHHNEFLSIAVDVDGAAVNGTTGIGSGLTCCESGHVNSVPSFYDGRFFAASGRVIDAQSPNLLAVLADPADAAHVPLTSTYAVLPDPTTGRIFTLSQPWHAEGAPQGTYRVHAFDLATYRYLASMEVQGFDGTEPIKLVRWGDDGLAILDAEGAVFLMRETLVRGVP